MAGSLEHIDKDLRMKRLLSSVFEDSELANRQDILRVVRTHAPLDRMLDLGCYDGTFTLELKEAARSTRAVGVEFLREHADRARARDLEVEEADLNEPLPFADGSFDLVHANQVIEHLRGTDQFLAETARVTSPGGIVVLSTNNLASWHNIVSLTLGFQPFPNHVSDSTHVGNPLNPRDGTPHADAGQTHLRIFTGRAFSELATFHGLEVIEMRSSGYYPFPPRIARHLARLDKRHGAFLIGVFRRPS